jgi:Vam6/Vps39-like protein vacuolar protein sorting-associated protein 39
LDDTPEAESLPRGRVVEYLASIKKALAIRYLEHLIHDVQEMGPTFHDRLVSLYLDEASNRILDEDGGKEVREKLLKFLEESNQYMPERILARLQSSTIPFVINLMLR